LRHDLGRRSGDIGLAFHGETRLEKCALRRAIALFTAACGKVASCSTD